MSAPDTNVEKMERRHRPVALVLRGLVLLAGLALAGFVASQVLQGGEAPADEFGEAGSFEAGGQASAAVD